MDGQRNCERISDPGRILDQAKLDKAHTIAEFLSKVTGRRNGHRCISHSPWSDDTYDSVDTTKTHNIGNLLAAAKEAAPTAAEETARWKDSRKAAVTVPLRQV